MPRRAAAQCASGSRRTRSTAPDIGSSRSSIQGDGRWQEVACRADRLRRAGDPGWSARQGAGSRRSRRSIKILTPQPRGSARAASAAPPTRFRSRCPRGAPVRWQCAGSSSFARTRREKPDVPAASRASCSTRSPTAGRRLQAARTTSYRMAQANEAFAHYRW